MSELRITGGIHKGRKIEVPTGRETRPTQSRLRASIFNQLQGLIQDARVLDLFAGSGALGLESLSRGAASVMFVENHKAAVSVIRRNIALLKAEHSCELRSQDVFAALRFFENTCTAAERFHIVFADPPYRKNIEKKLLTDMGWSNILAVGGRLYLEWLPSKEDHSALPEEVPGLRKIREQRYGDTWLTTYERPAENALEEFLK